MSRLEDMIPDDEYEGSIPFYPLHMTKEIMVVVGVLIVLLGLATLHPAGLQGAADSFKTPPHIKPEWYFVAMYQALKYVPSGMAFLGLTYLNLAMVVTGLLILAMMAVPFLDKSPYTMARKRPVFTALGVCALIFMLVFTYLGVFSGGRDPIFGVFIH